MSLALFAALALTSAPAFAVDGPQTLSDAQAQIQEVLAPATIGKPRLAALSCRAYPRALNCSVQGEHRKFRVSPNPSREEFHLILAEASGKRYVELLTPGISHDYDVYYQFDEAAYAAFVKGETKDVKGVLIEDVERSSPRTSPAVCVPGEHDNVSYYSLTGELNVDTLKLKTSRGGDSAMIAPSHFRGAVDERCGTLTSQLEDNFNYYVTPAHYWGEDILQLPKTAPVSGASFRANLHTCQYDGEWHASDDVALQCTLTSR